MILSAIRRWWPDSVERVYRVFFMHRLPRVDEQAPDAARKYEMVQGKARTGRLALAYCPTVDFSAPVLHHVGHVS